MKRTGTRDECFAPISTRNAHTLILGSLPGRRSLELQQYYAHPQNAFWKLIAAIQGSDPAADYRHRVAHLKTHGIALWDVCAAAERPGSLDSAIRSATANDFATFFRSHPEIRRVFFNGRKSEDIYRRRVLPGLGVRFAHIEYASLPSTSPAHAGLSFEQKLAQWRVIGDVSQA